MKNFEITKKIEKSFGFFKRIPLLPILIDEQVKVFTLFFRPKVFSKMVSFTSSMKQMKDVTANYHRYGGLEFSVNGFEFGHMHGDGLIDLRFNKRLKKEIVACGLAEPHHVMAHSAWVSYSIVAEQDIEAITQLAILAYQWRITQDEELMVSRIKKIAGANCNH